MHTALVPEVSFSSRRAYPYFCRGVFYPYLSDGEVEYGHPIFICENNRKRNFYNWIGWAFSSIKDLDIYTSKEELNAIWLEMCKEVRNGKETWFDWDLRRLFQDVKTSLSSEVVAS